MREASSSRTATRLLSCCSTNCWATEKVDWLHVGCDGVPGVGAAVDGVSAKAAAGAAASTPPTSTPAAMRLRIAWVISGISLCVVQVVGRLLQFVVESAEIGVDLVQGARVEARRGRGP